MNALSEAEIQTLIAVLELARRGKPVDSEHLAEITYFRKYRKDWGDALADLMTWGFLSRQGAAYALTGRGTEAAERLREARPPMYYWYTEFYEATRTSAAYAQFCQRVFGRNFAQHGFSDMAQVGRLIEVLALGQGDRVLDLGCGNGAMAEYVADVTRAHVTGIDYVPEAIRQARERTQARPDCLAFYVGDIGHLLDERSRLRFAPGAFDALISIDTLYFTDLHDTVRQMRDLLVPGGRMGVFYAEGPGPGGDVEAFDKETLLPDRTTLAQALRANGLEFDAWDFTQADYEHARLKKQAIEMLRPDLEAEGNGFLYENRHDEAVGVLSAIDAGLHARYLYCVRER